MKRRCATVLLLLSTACDDVGHVVTDRGQVCINRDQVLEFRQTGDLEITVRVDCDTECVNDPTAECEAAVDGSQIQIDSIFTWADSTDDSCKDKCETLVATCTVPKTFPGTYTLMHGADQFPLDLPSNPLIECLAPAPQDEDE